MSHLLLTILCGPALVLADSTFYQYDVLVIHSYHKDMEWVEQLQAGIHEAFAQDRSSIDLKVEYMDSKRYVADDYFTMLTALWRYKYRDDPPDCIIVCDDNALNLLLGVREDIFPGIPVVFCGINHYDPERFGHYRAVTGVVEEFDLPGTLDLLRALFPERRNLLVINDDTATGRANRKRLEALSYRYSTHFRFMYSGNVSATDLMMTVDSLDESSAILLMSFNRDAEGKVLRYRDAIRLVRTNSTVPIFGVWSFYLGRGLFGGSLVNGNSQGKTAAELCLRILKGESADSIPVIHESPNAPMFDMAELKRFSIAAGSLPFGSIVVNAPDTLWFRHKYKIMLGLCVVVVQGVLIVLLVYNARRRLRSEQNLRRTRNSLSTTLESLGDGVVSMDGNLTITQANSAAARIFGVAVDDLRGRTFTELLEELDPAGGIRLAESAVMCQNIGEKVEFPEDSSLQVGRRPLMHIQGSCAPIRNEEREIVGAVAIFHDATERKSMQIMLSQSRRLEAIGQLAGGVAHDFNNILAGISGYAEMLALQLHDNEKLKTSAVRIQQAAQRAAELTRQLLSFARKGKVMSSTIDCHETLESVIGLLQRTIDKNVIITERYNAECAVIVGDPAQLENVFLNLGINGADAMPNGGELLFTTENIELHSSFPCDFGEVLDPGLYLSVSVKDTGHGIDQEMFQKIFEPFFTTKAAGKGTGLGLAAVYGAVKEHGGALKLSSQVGKGSEFTLYFPAQRGTVDREREEKGEGRGYETVLLIDDEQLILSSASGLLQELGFTVLTAKGAERGLQVYQREMERIDLILLDMIMPELDGVECCKRLRVLNPEVKIVICSGFTKTGRFREIEELGVQGYLQKPFSGSDVARIIRQVCRDGGTTP